MLGQHKCAVPQWNDAKLTYVGTTDSVGGQGEQRGYFHNIHTNGDTSYGTFDAKLTMSDAPTVEGAWRFAGGTGSMTRLSGEAVGSGVMSTARRNDWDGA
jgi:outer membrane protein assembly factor BamB